MKSYAIYDERFSILNNNPGNLKPKNNGPEMGFPDLKRDIEIYVNVHNLFTVTATLLKNRH